MLLRRTMNNANARLNQAGQLMVKADDLADLVEDIALDVRDGMKVTFVMLPGFSVFVSKFVRSVARFAVDSLIYKLRGVLPGLSPTDIPNLNLSWLEGEQIPVGLSIDLEYDALPPHDSPIKFVGGVYDGQTFSGGLGHQFGPDGPSYGKTRVTMRNGEDYVWNGAAMVYDASRPRRPGKG